MRFVESKSKEYGINLFHESLGRRTGVSSGAKALDFGGGSMSEPKHRPPKKHFMFESNLENPFNF